MRVVTLAATQMACGWDRDANLAAAQEMVRRAAGQGANVVLLQELFETPYFCPDQKEAHFGLARPFDANPMIASMAQLAAELQVVLPVSFFERAGDSYFNTLAVIDDRLSCLGGQCHMLQRSGSFRAQSRRAL